MYYFHLLKSSLPVKEDCGGIFGRDDPPIRACKAEKDYVAKFVLVYDSAEALVERAAVSQQSRSKILDRQRIEHDSTAVSRLEER